MDKVDIRSRENYYSGELDDNKLVSIDWLRVINISGIGSIL